MRFASIGLGAVLIAAAQPALASGFPLATATGTVSATQRFGVGGSSHTGTGGYDDHLDYKGFGSTSAGNLSTITPFVSAAGQGPACFCGPGTGGGEGRASLSYSFAFVGGDPSEVIPLSITYKMTLSAKDFGVADGQFLVFRGPVAPFLRGSIYNDSTQVGGTTGVYSLDVTRHFAFYTLGYAENSIYMAARAISSDSFTFGSAMAFVDPIISIDPGFAALHPEISLVLSEGVLNREPGAAGVPEPAAWVLLAGGLGMAGAALRRRRSIARDLLRLPS
ncbi:PEP-CTERM sorting domain-containing protein [Phenylobacterium sp.]|uniref:PEP-CTERM sorting domain-containing protein n=1 Tax=Phenylobacterium sp. TaxID=1871053 RepID=UPI00286CA5F0|nr:PEP-CTERM sorting domain-containing protein [Phenylobacterium sp.]